MARMALPMGEFLVMCPRQHRWMTVELSARRRCLTDWMGARTAALESEERAKLRLHAVCIAMMIICM